MSMFARFKHLRRVALRLGLGRARSLAALSLLVVFGAASSQAEAQISVLSQSFVEGCPYDQTLGTFGSLGFSCGTAAPGGSASVTLESSGHGAASASGYGAALATMDYTVKVLGPDGLVPTINVPLVFSAMGYANGLRSQASMTMTFDDGTFIAGQSAECIVGGCFVRLWNLGGIGFSLQPGEYVKINVQVGVAGFGTTPYDPGVLYTGSSVAEVTPIAFQFRPGFDSTGYRIVFSDGIGVSAVPEPATAGLTLSGLLLLAFAARRRRGMRG